MLCTPNASWVYMYVAIAIVMHINNYMHKLTSIAKLTKLVVDICIVVIIISL